MPSAVFAYNPTPVPEWMLDHCVLLVVASLFAFAILARAIDALRAGPGPDHGPENYADRESP